MFLVLSDLNPEVVFAWTQIFADYQNVSYRSAWPTGISSAWEFSAGCSRSFEIVMAKNCRLAARS
jgi:hypothetical protein